MNIMCFDHTHLLPNSVIFFAYHILTRDCTLQCPVLSSSTVAMSAIGRNDRETLLPVMVAKGSYNGCDDPALECVLRNPH